MRLNRKILWVLELGLFLLAALALYFFLLTQYTLATAPRIADNFIDQRDILAQTVESVDTQYHPSLPAIGVPDQTKWSTERKNTYKKLSHAADLPVIAVLKIPERRVLVPIYQGTSHAVLDRGAGWIDGTAELSANVGNTGIAAHRDGFFRGLKDVQIGEHIEVATLTSDLVYQVTELDIVEPSNVSVLESRNKTELTLVTCYPFYFVGKAPKRYIVKAELIRSTTRERAAKDH